MLPQPPSPPASSQRANPLERLSRGGWRKGVLRLAVGGVLVGVVVHLTAGDALAQLLSPAVAMFALIGGMFHVAQRAARIAKWRHMLRGGPLRQQPFPFLLRVQFIGMLANLLLPISEALKVWVVSRNRRDALSASESIVADTALHAGLIGMAGLLGAVLVAELRGSVWLAAGGMVGASLLLLGGLRWWPRRSSPGYGFTAPALIWCALETVAQLALYLLALHAVGVALSPMQVLAYAPMLFLADLVMVTPSGIGLREALFATVLAAHTEAAPDTSVAVGLLVSGMLLLATLMGGGLALLLPGDEPPTPDHAEDLPARARAG